MSKLQEILDKIEALDFGVNPYADIKDEIWIMGRVDKKSMYKIREISQEVDKAFYMDGLTQDELIMIRSKLYDKKRVFFRPISVVEKEAKEGIADAQYQLFNWYSAVETEEFDKKAIYWCEKSAVQSHPQAMFAYACCLMDGEFVEKDLEKAAEYFTKAAEFDNDDISFVKLEELAEQGVVNALYGLSKCYENGWGCEKDLELAKTYYQKAETTRGKL